MDKTISGSCIGHQEMHQSDCCKSHHSLQNRHFGPEDIVEKIPDNESYNEVKGSQMTHALFSRNPKKRQGIYIHDRYPEDNSRQIKIFHCLALSFSDL